MLVLGVTTFKLYFFYWCYKNWRDLAQHAKARESAKEAEQTEAPTPSTAGFFESLRPETLSHFENISPLICTIGILIPYINNYLYLTLAMGIARLLPNKDSWPAKHPLSAALAIVIVSIIFDLMAFLQSAWYLLFFLSVIPLCVVQHWLNKYWESIEPLGLKTRSWLSGPEVISILAGSLLLGLIVASYIMGNGLPLDSLTPR